jgi:hypothetical protein
MWFKVGFRRLLYTAGTTADQFNVRAPWVGEACVTL